MQSLVAFPFIFRARYRPFNRPIRFHSNLAYIFFKNMYTTGLYLKNIGDCVPSQDESIGTPLDSPSFLVGQFL